MYTLILYLLPFYLPSLSFSFDAGAGFEVCSDGFSRWVTAFIRDCIWDQGGDRPVQCLFAEVSSQSIRLAITRFLVFFIVVISFPTVGMLVFRICFSSFPHGIRFESWSCFQIRVEIGLVMVCCSKGSARVSHPRVD